jgi:hypothetical protein
MYGCQEMAQGYLAGLKSCATKVRVGQGHSGSYLGAAGSWRSLARYPLSMFGNA